MTDLNEEQPTDAGLGELYRSQLLRLEKLSAEAVYTIESALGRRKLKIHSLTSRVKELDSFVEKVRRKKYASPLREMQDMVGLRVVSLFLSDLPKIRDLLHSVFQVVDEENKIDSEDVASFGYMSVHFICRLGDRHSGARYDDIKDLDFEVQTRTIVMDAWANVSHHLAYKGEASIPQELRRDFHALSGLFYVADQHFEMLARAGGNLEHKAQAALGSDEAAVIPINTESIMAYVRNRYPDKKRSRKSDASEFAEELLEAGYKNISDLDVAARSGEGSAISQDLKRRTKFTDLGMVRVAVAAIDPVYDQILNDRVKGQFLGLLGGVAGNED